MKTTLLLAMTVATAATASAFTPVAPSPLKAEVNGMLVELSWEWGNAGKATLSEGFENEQFPPASWKIQKGNTHDEYANWMQFDFSQEDMKLNHGGDKAAILQMAMVGDDDNLSTYHQDEWLICKPGTGAVYMDFWYWLHPEILEYGGIQDFPDHYYVMLSRDNGDTWYELWDGRWDMGETDAVQQASLYLGEPSDENTLVAFRAESGQEMSLHSLWAIDDVEFFTAEENAERKLNVTSKKRAPFKMPEGLKTHRKFTPAPGAKKIARIPQSEWLNDGNTTFRVYIDGELVKDYLKARHYTDWSTKEEGDHEYKVLAWSEAEDTEYPAAVETVHIDKYVFEAPVNVQAYSEETPDGRYTVRVKWDAPEGNVEPDHYNIYINNKFYGYIDSFEELSVGQSGLYKGVYKFEVESAYLFPEGTSERIASYTFPGTVPTPVNVKVVADGSKGVVTWEKPTGDLKLEGYRIYRNDEILADNLKELTYTDSKPLAGTNIYSVHAIYADSKVSLPECASLTVEGKPEFSLPYTETFDNGHLPYGWEIELVDPNKTIKDMYSWRFDNWFDTPVSTPGFEGNFASVSSVAAGMNRLITYLYSPEFYIPTNEPYMLSFIKHYTDNLSGPLGSAEFKVQITANDGELWNDLEDLKAKVNGERQLALDTYAGRNVRFRWYFFGRNSGEAAIDKVCVKAGVANGIDDINDTDPAIRYDAYTTDGICVATGISRADADNLPAGIYLLRGNGKTVKVAVK